MFTYNFVEGNAATALNNPNTVVISEDIAQKFFGNEPALNKVLHISSGTNGDHDFLVTGVFKPINKPSHIDARFFMSMMGGNVADFIKQQGADLATNNLYFTYLLLRPGTDTKELEAKFPAFLDKYAGKYLKAFGFDKKQFLVPLKKIHLNEDVKGNITQGGSVTYLYILASIAMFTLLIACINFMNLSTARSSKRSSEVGIRKVLGAEKKSLVAQFLGESVLISVVLIVASVVIADQMQYLRSADLGFDKDRQIVIPLRSQNAKKMYASFENELLKQFQIINAGASRFYPGIANVADNIYYKEGQNMHEGKDVRMNYIDTRYLQTLNIQPIAGHLFSADFPTDTNRVILNESAIKELGFSSAQQTIGKKVYFDYRDSTYGFEIAAVVKDFHFEDLHVSISPYGFQLNNMPDYNYMIVHAKPGNINTLLQIIQNTWRNLNPTEPFEYSFLDEDFQKNYEAENHLAAIVGYFTAIAILISCLGLFGLATFSAEQRTKEIGVRKVLGASVAGIVALLSKDFLKLVAISIVIASPLAWWIMHKWLQDFAYRTKISWTVFVITTVAALLIALITISFQAIRAAISNPVKSLRTE